MRTRHLPTPVLVAAGVACLAVGITALAVPSRHPAGARAAAAVVAAPAGAGALAAQIARSQQHLRAVPGDWQEWASLGLDYVQQAKNTVDPTYYPKAAAALGQSLALNRSDNFVAMAGEATLAAGRHDFRAALAWARRGLRIDPQSAVLEGARCDALTQLGRYRAAAAAARRMELLSPGSAAEARLSYAEELRGHVAAARAFMRLALQHAGSPADVAFARYYLGELALNTGRTRTALQEYNAGLRANPAYPALLEGRAKAEAALGRTGAAVRDFATVVARVPQPAYVLEYGALLQSLGRTEQARQQYAVFRTEEQLFAANGVRLDTDETLFEADHGNVMLAVTVGRQSLRTRPFLESWDAYGWALHRAGRDHAALRAADRALRTGMRNALFYFHRGMIERWLGSDAAARRDLDTALHIDPTFSPVLAPMARRVLGGAR